MSRAYAVIGANYGDEGKGAVVNHLAKLNPGSTVVRFSGGPQAGHTVQLANSRKTRHVFHSFGSGSLQGSPTAFTSDMLINPVALLEEMRELEVKGPPPSLISVPENGIVITPWDVALNQFLELGRGPNRHGSVGHGINETMVRHLDPIAPKLVASELRNEAALNGFTSRIGHWYRHRLTEEFNRGNLEHLPGGMDSALTSEVMAKMLLKFYEYPHGFLATSRTRLEQAAPTTESGLFIFEGSQGLLLDQDDKEHFPHVTRASTGLRNVVRACAEWGVTLEKVFYVTRPYLTRHGAGPILKGAPCGDLWDLGEDKTNRPNPYQESIRFAKMDWKEFSARIEKDLLHAGKTPPEVEVVMTCSDQLMNQETYGYIWGDFQADMPTGTDEQVNDFLKYTGVMLGKNLTSIDGRKG